MIDRVKFVIKDVDFDIIEHLDLTLDELYKKKYVNEVYEGNIENLTVRYHKSSEDRYMTIKGSLHKYFKGNNYSSFSVEEAKKALLKLEKAVGISKDRFMVQNVELGVYVRMSKTPMRYIQTIKNYKFKEFIPMTPYETKVMGYRCKLTNYEIKFYNKTYDAKAQDKQTAPKNTLRYEIKMSNKYATKNGFIEVTAEKMLDGIYFRKAIRLMNSLLKKLVYLDLSFNYEGLKPNEIKEYFFITSDNFKFYAEHLKDLEEKNPKEKVYKNAMDAKRRLIEKLKPKLTGEFEVEFKEKLEKGIKSLSKKEK